MSEEFTETVYEHVSGRDTFTVTAAEQWSKTMVNNLKKKLLNDRIYLVGRFAEWEYCNMDVAIGAAIDLVSTL